MLPQHDRVKGIHPGAILKRELNKRNLKSIELARSINEHPQTINAITKERRGINPKLSIKLGHYFNSDIEYFMLLQASYEVKCSIATTTNNSLIDKFRSSIFWDTDPKNLDTEKHQRFIIQRVLERGNENEIKSLISHYSLKTIENELKQIKKSFNPGFERNVEKYILQVN